MRKIMYFATIFLYILSTGIACKTTSELSEIKDYKFQSSTPASSVLLEENIDKIKKDIDYYIGLYFVKINDFHSKIKNTNNQYNQFFENTLKLKPEFLQQYIYSPYFDIVFNKKGVEGLALEETENQKKDIKNDTAEKTFIILALLGAGSAIGMQVSNGGLNASIIFQWAISAMNLYFGVRYHQGHLTEDEQRFSQWADIMNWSWNALGYTYVVKIGIDKLNESKSLQNFVTKNKAKLDEDGKIWNKLIDTAQNLNVLDNRNLKNLIDKFQNKGLLPQNVELKHAVKFVGAATMTIGLAGFVFSTANLWREIKETDNQDEHLSAYGLTDIPATDKFMISLAKLTEKIITLKEEYNLHLNKFKSMNRLNY